MGMGAFLVGMGPFADVLVHVYRRSYFPGFLDWEHGHIAAAVIGDEQKPVILVDRDITGIGAQRGMLADQRQVARLLVHREATHRPGFGAIEIIYFIHGIEVTPP